MYFVFYQNVFGIVRILWWQCASLNQFASDRAFHERAADQADCCNGCVWRRAALKAHAEVRMRPLFRGCPLWRWIPSHSRRPECAPMGVQKQQSFRGRLHHKDAPCGNKRRTLIVGICAAAEFPNGFGFAVSFFHAGMRCWKSNQTVGAQVRSLCPMVKRAGASCPFAQHIHNE